MYSNFIEGEYLKKSGREREEGMDIKIDRHGILSGIGIISSIVFLIFLKTPRMGVFMVGGSMAGFWQGFVHGYMIVIDILRSFFDKSISIYESHNTGIGYNIGFWIGQFTWCMLGKISLNKAYR